MSAFLWSLPALRPKRGAAHVELSASVGCRGITSWCEGPFRPEASCGFLAIVGVFVALALCLLNAWQLV